MYCISFEQAHTRASYPQDPRAFGSYTNLYNVHDPYQARFNIHGGKPVPPPHFAQSDAFLHKKGTPVTRTHSDLSKAKIPPAPMLHRPPGRMGGSWNPYGHGVLMPGIRPPHPHTQSLDRRPKAVFNKRLGFLKKVCGSLEIRAMISELFSEIPSASINVFRAVFRISSFELPSVTLIDLKARPSAE